MTKKILLAFGIIVSMSYGASLYFLTPIKSKQTAIDLNGNWNVGACLGTWTQVGTTLSFTCTDENTYTDTGTLDSVIGPTTAHLDGTLTGPLDCPVIDSNTWGGACSAWVRY